MATGDQLYNHINILSPEKYKGVRQSTANLMELLEDIGPEYLTIKIIDLIKVINQKTLHEKTN